MTRKLASAAVLLCAMVVGTFLAPAMAKPNANADRTVVYFGAPW